MAAFGAATTGAATTFGAPGAINFNPNKDVELSSPPTDGISALAFSPTSNFLVGTSWDKNVRCWEVQPNGTSAPKAMISHDAPVLCCDWSTDGTTVFSGGCDKTVKMWSLQTNQQQKVAEHDAPIRALKFIRDLNLLVTGSWDKTLKYWDLRAAAPVHTQQLPERVYAMDCNHPLLVVGTADRTIQVFNLASPHTVYKQLQSPLKFQTRCISCFPDKQGYLVGSIEGRVAVHHVEDAAQSKNFTFKCHRHDSDVYAVNSIAFHPQYGTFVTTGDDGAYNFWDKDSKQRLKAMQRADLPVPAGTFNRDGSIYAYAVSYDWYKGYSAYNTSTMKNWVLLHSPQESEVKNRSRPSRR